MDSARTPVGLLQKIEVIDRAGKPHLIGWIFAHQNKLLQAIIGTPLRWHFDFNAARHNRRTERL